MLDVVQYHEQSTAQVTQISGEDTSVIAIHVRSKLQSKQPKFWQSIKTGQSCFHTQQLIMTKCSSYHVKPKETNGCSHCGYRHSDSSCPTKGNQYHKCGRHCQFVVQVQFQ